MTDGCAEGRVFRLSLNKGLIEPARFYDLPDQTMFRLGAAQHP
jgi:hypothetical protein